MDELIKQVTSKENHQLSRLTSSRYEKFVEAS